jgi:hypothetical protein
MVSLLWLLPAAKKPARQKNNDMSSTAQNASGKKVKLSHMEQRDLDALERWEHVEARSRGE